MASAPLPPDSPEPVNDSETAIDSYEVDRDLSEQRLSYKSLPNAIVGGAFGAGWIWLLTQLPNWTTIPVLLPALLPAVIPALIGSTLASVVGNFVRAGYDVPLTRTLAKIIDRTGASISSFFLWKIFPFSFGSVGLGLLDSVMPWIFLLGGIGAAAGALGSLISLITGRYKKKEDKEYKKELKGELRSLKRERKREAFKKLFEDKDD